MSRILYKIFFPIILASVFVVVVFLALEHQNLNPSFYIILGLVLFFTFFFGVATGQRFASPIEELLMKAKEIEGGNFSQRAYIETKDEIAELGGVLNDIAQKLEANQAEREKTREFIDVKVRAKTKDLEETILGLEQKVQNRTIELQRVMHELENLKHEIKNNRIRAEE